MITLNGAQTQAALRSNLYSFFVKCMADVMPGNAYQHNWHMVAMCTAIEKMISGETQRQIINIHPRMGKSLLCSVALPMFLLMRDPTCQIMCLSYSESLASDFHQKCRIIAQQSWYRELNPALEFKDGAKAPLLKSSSEILQTSKLGYRFASSIGGSFTGKGADWIILDDPNDMAMINSQAHRDKVNNTFDHAIASRLNSKAGRILMVSQRGHIDDLTGHLLEKGSFEQLKIESVARGDQVFDLGKAGSYQRKKGELIHPERFGQREVDERRLDLGASSFEAQYQQDPQPPGGVIFKKEWLTFVKPPPEFQYVFITADIAQTQGAGDWSAFVIWGYHAGTWYVLNAHRVQYDMPGVLAYIQKLDRQYEPDLTVIESNGPGKGVAAMLIEKGLRNVDTVTVLGSKIVRALDVTDLLQTGKVVFSEKMQGSDLFLSELLSFPNSKHDDYVDAFTLALHWRADILRVANQFRRPTRKHLPQDLGNMVQVSIYDVGSSGSGDRYHDRMGRDVFGRGF